MPIPDECSSHLFDDRNETKQVDVDKAAVGVGRVVVDVTPRLVSCHFGRVSAEALLDLDNFRDADDDRTQSVRSANVGCQRPDCLRCRQRRACCSCDRQLNVAGRKFTAVVGVIAVPEVEYDAWACWHCFCYDVAEPGGECAFIIAGNGLTAIGSKREETKAENGSGGTMPAASAAAAAGSSPRAATREITSLCHVNRAPGGNWWGSRGTSGTPAKAESYEFFHCRRDSPDDVGPEVDELSDSNELSAYATLYRNRYTVLNIGSVRPGDRTLMDLDPADDPYMRKFRTCGDIWNRIQQMMSADEEFVADQTSPRFPCVHHLWRSRHFHSETLYMPDLQPLRSQSSDNPHHGVFKKLARKPSFSPDLPCNACRPSHKLFTATDFGSVKAAIDASIRHIAPSHVAPPRASSAAAGRDTRQSQQSDVCDRLEGGETVGRAETSPSGCDFDPADSRLAVRTLLTAITSTSGPRPDNGASRGISVTVVNPQVLFERRQSVAATTGNVSSGPPAASRRNRIGSSQHQRVAGLCVLSGDLLSAPPGNSAPSSNATEGQDSQRRHSQTLRPQLRNVRQQQHQRTTQSGTTRASAASGGHVSSSGGSSMTSTLSPSVLTIRSRAASDPTITAPPNVRWQSSLYCTSAEARRSSSKAENSSCVDETTTTLNHVNHTSLSGRQFQTIASRLQLAAVRPPAEFSLLVRLP